MLVGIDKQLQQIKDWLTEWGGGKRGLILHGPPGTGKTESTYEVAKELGYKVVEFNASDERGKDFMQSLLRLVTCASLEKTLVLLDEADGVEDKRRLSRVLALTKKPVVLTANDMRKLGGVVREFCSQVRFYRPRLRSALKVAKLYTTDKEGVDYSNVMPDFRQATLVARGTEGYKPYEGRLSRLNSMLKSGEFEKVDMVDLTFLLDNAGTVFYGKQLYDFLRAIALCDVCKKPHPLYGLKGRGNISESYYYNKLREARRRQ